MSSSGTYTMSSPGTYTETSNTIKIKSVGFVIVTLLYLFGSLTILVIYYPNFMDVGKPVIISVYGANANLFVSAENSQFSNHMSGPQVIEVVVIDSSISDTVNGVGEPDVTVNGKKLRMVQAVDGNWYAYFADKTMVITADATTTTQGQGLDFGSICTAVQATGKLAITLSDTSGVAIPYTTCTGTLTADIINVVREPKDVNINSPTIGQIGLTSADTWPFIQLYNLNPTGNVEVNYNKGGGVQSTTLIFDTVDQFVKLDLDKTKYTKKSQVHLTVTDPWLNIDPTDEDSWTFGTKTGSLSTNYQVFDENGKAAGSTVSNGVIDITSQLPSLMAGSNRILEINPNVQNSPTKVLTIQDNDESIISCPVAQDITTCLVATDANGNIVTSNGLLIAGSQPITITEQGPNSGIFGTYDILDKSILKITDNAERGTTASINYNLSSKSVVVGFDFATLSIVPTDAEWNSGEEIPVTLVDGDATTKTWT